MKIAESMQSLAYTVMIQSKPLNILWLSFNFLDYSKQVVWTMKCDTQHIIYNNKQSKSISSHIFNKTTAKQKGINQYITKQVVFC